MNFTCRLIPYVLIVLVSLTSCLAYSESYDNRIIRQFPRVDNRNRYQETIRQRNRCNKNIEIENGDRRFRERGSLVKFNCNNGYTLVGATIAVCLRDEWSEPIPYCVKAGCRRIVVPEYSFMRQSFGGGVVYFYCNDGFRLEGSDMLTCNGRQWNGTEPTCQAIHPPTTSSTTMKPNDETTLNLEAWDENIITSIPNNTNINADTSTTNSSVNESSNNTSVTNAEEITTISYKRNRTVTSNDNSTDQSVAATVLPQPHQRNISEVSGNNMSLNNSTVPSISEDYQRRITTDSIPTQITTPIPETTTVLPTTTGNNKSARINNSNSTEDVTVKSQLNPSSFTPVISNTVTPTPNLLNATISTSTLKNILITVSPVPTTISTRGTIKTTTTTTTLQPTTVTTTTTTTPKPTTVTTTTTLKPTTITTTTTTPKPTTVTTTTTTRKPRITTTTSKPTTSTTSKPTTTTTKRITTAWKPTIRTTTSKPTTTTTRRAYIRKSTTRMSWPTSKSTTTTRRTTTTSKPTTTTSTTTKQTPRKIIVPTTQKSYWSYDYDDNTQDNHAPLIPHRPVDNKGTKSRKEIVPSTKASQLNVASSDHTSFGHILYVFGMIVVALVSLSVVGVTARYCWRKNKGIARARSYDMDGRTLSAHDANDDFMWLENR